jgi:hypothetical protein
LSHLFKGGSFLHAHLQIPSFFYFPFFLKLAPAEINWGRRAAQREKPPDGGKEEEENATKDKRLVKNTEKKTFY